MPPSLLFYLNGREITVDGNDAFQTVAHFVRGLGETGTKLVCEEGDCGSCSVLVGRPEGDAIVYRPINSCIQFVYQMAGAHIVTVEGIGRRKELHPVQQAMVACHGAQCGFCTPGFIVAMCSLFESRQNPDEIDVRNALTGNLCRCTGYEPIIKAAMSVDPATVRTMNERYPPNNLLPRLREATHNSLLIEADRRFFAPVTVAEAVRFKADNLGTIIVQGATDVGVLHNKRGFDPPVVMNLSRIPALREIALSAESNPGEAQTLEIGATVTLSELEPFFREHLPQFARILHLFGAPQIRNAGTLAGNIANGSPIADTLPFLYVMGASVELTGTAGVRRIGIESLYLGYRKLDLRPDEIITRIFLPLPAAGEILELYKVSKRRHLDISTITAAIRLGQSRDGVTEARIAFGGVGPTVVRLRATEQFLIGKTISRETLRAAGAIAREEISPISDVRGSADFRRQLTQNIFSKLYFATDEKERSREDAARVKRDRWVS
ncbi:MAG TPA: FAD binding domain-containing protein [Thermoanaerobaculia bacterium]|nr:FAD binding domain-containing protein [Thermoanaerobaculia bacterium]